MPRTVEVSLPSRHTDRFISELRKMDGLMGLRLQKNGSIQPEGDVLSMELTDTSLSDFMLFMDKKGFLDDPSISVTTSEPLSIVSKSGSPKTFSDVNEATWEEMLSTLSKQSNMTLNNMVIMFISGSLAVIGIVTNALHIVVGAMVIAPGFLPLVRISLGFISKSINWKNGLGDTAKGYISLVAGAAITTLVLELLGKNPVGGESSYLPSGVLISYWTSLTVPSVLVTVGASIAGAIIIATHRSVLTAGVMIALALIPSAAILAIGVVSGNADIALGGLRRWAVDAGIIAVLSGVVFLWKKRSVHKRNTTA